jgi:hypothetical protein
MVALSKQTGLQNEPNRWGKTVIFSKRTGEPEAVV